MPSTESTTTSGASVDTTVTVTADAPSICIDLKTIADADLRTRDPGATSWEDQRTVVLDGADATIGAFDRAISDSAATGTDPSVTDDLTTVRTFTSATFDAVRSSVTFDDFTARVRALDSDAATPAFDRLNTFSATTCGFALTTGAP